MTTTTAANAFNQAEFNYAWYSADAGGLRGGWLASFITAADTDTARPSCPWFLRPRLPSARPLPEVSSRTQRPRLLAIPIWDRSNSIPRNDRSLRRFRATPTFTAKAVSAKQINLSWSAVGSAPVT